MLDRYFELNRFSQNSETVLLLSYSTGSEVGVGVGIATANVVVKGTASTGETVEGGERVREGLPSDFHAGMSGRCWRRMSALLPSPFGEW